MATLGSATLLVVACSDARPPAPSGLLVADDAATARSDASQPSDAATITEHPELCQWTALADTAIEEIAVGGARPDPTGGTLDQGTYVLVEMDTYDAGDEADAGGDGGETPSGGTTGQFGKSTIVVGEFSLSTIEAYGTTEGLGPGTTHGELYRIDGTSLVETKVCPTTAPPAAVPFSGINGALVLFPDATHRRLYARQP